MNCNLDLTHENYLQELKSMSQDVTQMDTRKILHHEYPFLFVDKIIKIDKENNCISAIKNVTNNEEFFNGHFPGFPIMPAVLITEALAQVATIFAMRAILGIEKDECDVRFLAIENAKFRKPVLPGDRLYLNVYLHKQKRDIFKFIGRAYTESGLCAEAEFTAAALMKKA